MTFYLASTGPISPGMRRRLALVCEKAGVSVEHMVAVVRARRIFRNSKKMRQLKRRRYVRMNGGRAKRFDRSDEVVLEGEGEFTALLKGLGLTEPECAAMFGIDRSRLTRWYGHPMHSWPIEFLRYYGRAQAMGRFLEAQGIDLEQFEPKFPPQAKGPVYPRVPAAKPKPQLPPLNREYSPWLKRS